MRPIWSGTVSFGLVTIPVKLYTAVSTKRVVSFRLLDSRDLTPIKEVRVNPETGKDVPWEDVVRGVEVKKDEFVPVTDEELKALPLPSAHTVELVGFADADEVDPKYFDSLYYLGPGNGGDRAYALLYRVKVHAKERKMASQLVSTMEMTFEPEGFKSEFKEALRKLIKARRPARNCRRPSGRTRWSISRKRSSGAWPQRKVGRARNGAKPAERLTGHADGDTYDHGVRQPVGTRTQHAAGPAPAS